MKAHLHTRIHILTIEVCHPHVAANGHCRQKCLGNVFKRGKSISIFCGGPEGQNITFWKPLQHLGKHHNISKNTKKNLDIQKTQMIYLLKGRKKKLYLMLATCFHLRLSTTAPLSNLVPVRSKSRGERDMFESLIFARPTPNADTQRARRKLLSISQTKQVRLTRRLLGNLRDTDSILAMLIEF